MKCPDLTGTVWWVPTKAHRKHTNPPRHRTALPPREHPPPCSQRRQRHFLAPLINSVCSKNSCKRNHATFTVEHEWWARRGRSGGNENLLYTCASENNLAVPQKVTQRDTTWPSNSPLRYTNSRKMNTYRHRTLYIRAALFIVTPGWTNSVSINWPMNKMFICIHTMEHCLGITRNYVQKEETRWRGWTLRPSGQVKEPVTKDPTLSYTPYLI